MLEWSLYPLTNNLLISSLLQISKISSVAFARGDPKTLIPEWSNDVDYNPAQGWFTNAVAQAKEDKGITIQPSTYI